MLGMATSFATGLLSLRVEGSVIPKNQRIGATSGAAVVIKEKVPNTGSYISVKIADPMNAAFIKTVGNGVRGGWGSYTWAFPARLLSQGVLPLALYDEPDTDYMPIDVKWLGGEVPPVGTDAIVVCGTAHDTQQLMALPVARPQLVAHDRPASPPERSTLVYDIDGDKLGVSARLNTVFRVANYPNTSRPVLQKSTSYGVALNFARSAGVEPDGTNTGYGLVMLEAARGRTSSPGPQPRSFAYMAFEPMKGPVTAFLAQNDVHVIGTNGDGETFHSAAISTEAFFLHPSSDGLKFNCPVEFTPQDVQLVPPSGFNRQGAIVWNRRIKHTGPQGNQIDGKWVVAYKMPTVVTEPPTDVIAEPVPFPPPVQPPPPLPPFPPIVPPPPPPGVREPATIADPIPFPIIPPIPKGLEDLNGNGIPDWQEVPSWIEIDNPPVTEPPTAEEATQDFPEPVEWGPLEKQTPSIYFMARPGVLQGEPQRVFSSEDPSQKWTGVETSDWMKTPRVGHFIATGELLSTDIGQGFGTVACPPDYTVQPVIEQTDPVSPIVRQWGTSQGVVSFCPPELAAYQLLYGYADFPDAISEPSLNIYSSGNAGGGNGVLGFGTLSETLGSIVDGFRIERFGTDTLLITGVDENGDIDPNKIVSVPDLYVAGKLTVTGLIDPTGLELTPVAANPGAAGVTLWIDSDNDNLQSPPLQLTSRFAPSVSVISGNGTSSETLGDDEYIVVRTWNTGTRTINLPAADQPRALHLRLVATGGGAFTIAPDGSDTIEAGTGFSTALPANRLLLITSGNGDWNIVQFEAVADRRAAA